MIDYRRRILEDFELLSKEDQEKFYAFLDNYLTASDEVREMIRDDINQSIEEFEALYGASEEVDD